MNKAGDGDPQVHLTDLRKANADVLGKPPDQIVKRIQKVHEESPLKRAFSYDKDTIDLEARTVEVAFSSDTPYMRWWGSETLGHDEGEVDLSRMDESVGAPVLVGHNWGGWQSPSDEQVGVVDSVRIEDGIGRATLRFGRSQKAVDIFNDIVDGIRRQVSVGYFVNEMVLTKQSDEDEPNEYRVTQWTPYEISIVPVAADFDRVGVGKSLDVSDQARISVATHKEVKTVEDDVNTPENPGLSEKDVLDKVNNAEANERQRATEMLAMGKQYGERDLADDFIAKGKSVDELTRAILEKRGQPVRKAEEDPNIGMEKGEILNFSLCRLIHAQADPSNVRAQKAAAGEFEACREAERKSGKSAEGTVIPYDVLSHRRSHSDFKSKREYQRALLEVQTLSRQAGLRRDYAVGTAADGGNLVATDLLMGSFIDRLENAMALRAAGMTVLNGLVGNIAVPRQNGGATSYWLDENEAATKSSATFDQVGMTPKTISAFSEFSRRLTLQTSMGVQAFVENELALRLALGLDLAGINGTGAANKQPLGILNQVGVGAVVTGGTLDWDAVVDLETELGDSNAIMGALTYLTNYRVRGVMKKTRVDPGSGVFLWNYASADSPVNGTGAVVSNQVPRDLGAGSNASALICGYFPDLIMGLWSGLDLQVNPYSLDTQGATRVTAFQDADIMVRHPESFSAAVDIAA